MVTKNIVRKDGLASYEGASVADGEQHPHHQHQLHQGNGFVQHQYHQPLPPTMHPLALPPPKKIKLHHQFASSRSASSGQQQHNLQGSQFLGDHQTPLAPAAASAKRPRPLVGKKRRSTNSAVAPPTPQRGTAAVPLQNPYSTSRGLRHFSMKVCEKVEEKGTTTYNEVADELVRELKLAEEAINMAAIARGEVPIKKKSKKSSNNGKTKKNHDDKNIRRRVYDALNVLMAMDIITKDKKEITWRGLPGSQVQNHLGDGSGISGDVDSNTRRNVNGLSRLQRMQQMQEELTKRQDDIRRKRECLQELMVQNVCFQNLLGRNHARHVEEMTRRGTTSAQQHQYGESSREQPDDQHDKCEEVKEIKNEKIPLPFIIINTDSRAIV
mmetsp:Transcript_17065/g.36818  ORF Transcript_17065/g.36818 Transcript_17065/m.36818 type:complete len:383 (-) Transcript_17065:419-1567(-)